MIAELDLSGRVALVTGGGRACAGGLRRAEEWERITAIDLRGAWLTCALPRCRAAEGRLAQRIVGPLELALGLGLVVPFERVRFFYLDASGQEQELFRMSAVAGVVDVGLGVAFP